MIEADSWMDLNNFPSLDGLTSYDKALATLPFFRLEIVWSLWVAVACGRSRLSCLLTWPSPCRSRWVLRKVQLCRLTTWQLTWCSLKWPTWGRARASSSTWQQVTLQTDRLLYWALLHHFALYSEQNVMRVSVFHWNNQLASKTNR